MATEEYDASQEFDSDLSGLRDATVRTITVGRNARRLWTARKAGKALQAAGVFGKSAGGVALLKVKLIILAVTAGFFLIAMVSIGFSSAAVNEALHVNNAETLATDRYEFDYSGSETEDMAVFADSVAFCKLNLDDAVEEAGKDARKRVLDSIRNMGYWGVDIYTNDTVLYMYPVSDTENLFVLSAYSAAMDNLLSETAEEHYNAAAVGDGMAQEIRKRIFSLASYPSTVYQSGNALIGADMELVDEEYDEETDELISVTFDVTYHEIDYNDAVSRAFSVDLSALYDPEYDKVTTYADRIFEISAATAELIGLTLDSDITGSYYVDSEALRNAVADGDIVRVAESQITGRPYNGEKYWKWYFGPRSSRVEWCACFVSWCADQLGYVDLGIVPKFSSVYQASNSGVKWFQSRGLFRFARGYTPKAGDIVFVDTKTRNGAQATHVGIVRFASADGKTIYTIEGNTQPDGGNYSTQEGVWKRARSVNQIYGYGIPRYDLVKGATQE